MNKLLIAVLLAGSVTACTPEYQELSDLGDDHRSRGSSDCGYGRNKIIAQDNGAGKTWACPNTSTWIDPRADVKPQDDPLWNKGGN